MANAGGDRRGSEFSIVPLCYVTMMRHAMVYSMYQSTLGQYHVLRKLNESLFLYSPRSIPLPRAPYVIRPWWTPTTGCVADPESPSGSWWPPLAGGVPPSCLLHWESPGQDGFAQATSISPGTTVTPLFGQWSEQTISVSHKQTTK